MTVTLMLRSAGALIFGAVSDRYGRKWPMIINLSLFIVLELASGFCNTLSQFLGVRALYGIAMGGLFGPAAATALEDLPYDARGVLSGFFELGYSTGYLFAAIFYRALVPTTTHGWRSLFWFGAGPPVLIIAYRLWLPETNGFQVMAAEREARLLLERQAGGQDGDNAAVPVKKVGLKSWFKESWLAMKEYWTIFIYLIFLMTGWNSISHGVSLLHPPIHIPSLLACLNQLTWNPVSRLLPYLPQKPSRNEPHADHNRILYRATRRHNRRHYSRLHLDVRRPSSDHDRRECYRRRLDPRIHLAPEHESRRVFVLHAVLRYGSMGANAYSSSRISAASSPRNRCRIDLSARQSCFVCVVDYPKHDRGEVSPAGEMYRWGVH